MSSTLEDGNNESRPAVTRPQNTTNESTTLISRLLEADVPNGMWTATATKTAQAPTLMDIREARYTTEKVSQETKPEDGQRAIRQSLLQANNSARHAPARPSNLRHNLSTTHSSTDTEKISPVVEPVKSQTRADSRPLSDAVSVNSLHITPTGHYPNGYQFPPKHTWQQSIRIGFQAFLGFLKTPLGVAVTLYGLNVVAWGAMIFFLLIGATSETMCNVQRPYGSGHWVHDCNDLYSPRRIWIEIDSQVLTILFCVTAFGLVPWRFRDLFYLLKWRIARNKTALRRLAAWHRSWYRLPGSNELDPRVKAGGHDITYNLPSLPEPTEKAPDPPLTGVRAPPTASWKMDFVVWGAAFNTFFQIVLCYYMWHMNRFKRPSWATGCFVALGCISAGVAGVMQFVEGKKIKKVEGIPLDVGQAVEQVANRDAGEQV